MQYNITAGATYELKTTKFKAEYAGKMNLHLNLLDDFVKEPHENPSIGIILCSDSSKFDVEYSLRGIDKPVGVAGYELTRDIPARLKDSLPAPEEIASDTERPSNAKTVSTSCFSSGSMRALTVAVFMIALIIMIY